MAHAASAPSPTRASRAIQPRYGPPIAGCVVLLALAVWFIVSAMLGDEPSTGSVANGPRLAPHPTAAAQSEGAVAKTRAPDAATLAQFDRVVVDPSGPSVATGARFRFSVTAPASTPDDDDPTRVVLVSPVAPSAEGTLLVRGAIVNRAGRRCKTVTFSVYAFDDAGALLGRSGGAARDLAAGARSTFEVELAGLKPGSVVAALRLVTNRAYWEPPH